MTAKTVYVLRTCNADLTSYNGFRWPASGRVTAPDWKPTNDCGNGLHGLLWGEGHGGHLSPDADARWLVIGVAEDSLIDLIGKVKFPKGEVVFCGDREDAIADIIQRGADPSKVCYNRVHAGHYGTATAGPGGTATAGDHSTATAGHHSTATAGHYGTATAGDFGTATAGECGTATAGYRGTATAGKGGEIRIRWFDYDKSRYRAAYGYVGEDGIKPNTPYVVQDGKLVEKE